MAGSDNGLAVATRGLCRTFGERQALDHVDLEVEPREVFGLLGPNGGGKSTFFRILSTLIAPSGGTALVFAHDVVREAAAVRTRIGVVFQSPSLDGKLTVSENLHYQGQLYGLTGKELRSRSTEMLERFGLGERSNDIVGELSGGLARRVEIAKGMLHRPRLLLLDEPSTGLDPAARRELWDQICSVRDSDGTTVVLTTHILDEAEDCDRVAILDAGKRIAFGTPSELKAEIAGDVVILDCADAAALAAEVRDAFGVKPEVRDRQLRFEADGGHGLAVQIAQRFGSRVQAMTIARPTLEDVFLDRTGHTFRATQQAPA